MGSVWRLAFGGGVALGYGVPIDDVPEGADVIRTAVLVLQVVGMLPNVESEDGGAFAIDVARHEGAVLVGCGADAEGAVGFNTEPGPTGTEAGSCGVGELLLEFGE